MNLHDAQYPQVHLVQDMHLQMIPTFIRCWDSHVTFSGTCTKSFKVYTFDIQYLQDQHTQVQVIDTSTGVGDKEEDKKYT